MFRKKSPWQRMTHRLPAGDDAKSVAKSGLVAMAGAVCLTAMSAIVSSFRKRDDE
jgi:hypothetical protein